jgi:uncharacterized protein YgbK (DUF1537 family)
VIGECLWIVADMIAVVADDYTGAAELAGIGFSHGLSSGIQTEFGPNCPDELVAIDTDSRSCPQPVAARRVAHIAGCLRSCGPTWIFKKVDSVLRGPVLAELRSMLVATGKRRAILAPANPSRGRIIRAGHYFVDGRPIEHSAFRNDPECPIRSSDVLTMLGGYGSPDVRVAGLDQELPDAGIIIAEAGTQEDVARWAASINSSTLAAGGADFFATLLAAKERHRGQPQVVEGAPPCGRRTLFVCGSATAWGASRREECAKFGIPIVLAQQTPPCIGASSRPTHFAKGLDAVLDALDRVGVAMVAAGNQSGSSPTTPHSAPGILVETVVQVLRRGIVARLFVEGGGTASALVRRMGWTRTSVCGQYAPGVVAMRVPSEPAATLTTKPGSYPWPTEVWKPFAGTCIESM